MQSGLRDCPARFDRRRRNLILSIIAAQGLP